MVLIVGLGNPGQEYESTHHNAGWMFLDYLKNLPESDFEEWKEKKKLNSQISGGFLDLSLRGLAKSFLRQIRLRRTISRLARPNEIARLAGAPAKRAAVADGHLPGGSSPRDDKVRIVLAKPTTFMNNSGDTVSKLVSSFKFQETSWSPTTTWTSRLAITKSKPTANLLGITV